VVVVHRAVALRLISLMARRRIVTRRLAVLLILAARRMRAGMGAAITVLHVRTARLVAGLRPALRVSATGVGRTIAVRLNAGPVAALGSAAFRAARLIFDSGMDAAPVLPLAAGILRAARILPHVAVIGTPCAFKLAAGHRIAVLAPGRRGGVLAVLGRGRAALLLAGRGGAFGTAVRAAGGFTARFLTGAAAITALLAAVFLTGAAALAAITLLGRFGGVGGQGGGRDRQKLGRRGEYRRQRRGCEELGHHRAGPFCSGAGTRSG